MILCSSNSINYSVISFFFCVSRLSLFFRLRLSLYNYLPTYPQILTWLRTYSFIHSQISTSIYPSTYLPVHPSVLLCPCFLSPPSLSFIHPFFCEPIFLSSFISAFFFFFLLFYKSISHYSLDSEPSEIIAAPVQVCFCGRNCTVCRHKSTFFVVLQQRLLSMTTDIFTQPVPQYSSD